MGGGHHKILNYRRKIVSPGVWPPHSALENVTPALSEQKVSFSPNDNKKSNEHVEDDDLDEGDIFIPGNMKSLSHDETGSRSEVTLR